MFKIKILIFEMAYDCLATRIRKFSSLENKSIISIIS
jgi:hypothetical protein